MKVLARLGCRLLALASLLVVVGAVGGSAPVSAAHDVPFRASYRGTFTLTFGPGPGAASNAFTGTGQAAHLGRGGLDGLTALIAASTPGCFTISQDRVTLIAANGDAVVLRNAGTDCLDTTSVPGTTIIRGTGTYAIVGGSGRFANAIGSGDFTVTARVTSQTPGGVAGTFDALTFDGTISSPGSGR